MVTTVFGGPSGEHLPLKEEAVSRRAPAARMRGLSRVPPWLLTFLKVALSVLAIVTVALKVDLSAVWQRVVSQNLALLSTAAVIMTLQVLIGGLRWNAILRALGADARVSDSIRLFYISVFFNAWLWGTVAGDVIRAWMCRRTHISTSTAVASVILDRVAAVAGIAVLVVVTAPLFIYRVGYGWSSLVPLAIALAGLLGICVAAQLHRLPVDWQRSRLLRGFHDLSHSARIVFLRPAATFRVMGLAIGAQVIMAITAYVLALSLNVGLSFLDSLVLMQPVVLIAALPISVGGWGVRETAMIAMLGLVGIPANAALSLSIQLGLLATVTTLPGAVLWLRLRHEQ